MFWRIQIGPISAQALSQPIVDRAVRRMNDGELWQSCEATESPNPVINQPVQDHLPLRHSDQYSPDSACGRNHSSRTLVQSNPWLETKEVKYVAADAFR